MKRIYRLVHSEARRRAQEDVKTAPDGFVVTVAEAGKSEINTVLKHSTSSKIGEPVKRWNAIQALTNQPVQEVIMAVANHICIHCKNQYFNKDRKSTYCSLRCFHAVRSIRSGLAASIKARHDNHVKVTPGCWLWTGLKTAAGYGRMGSMGEMRLAHRISYELYVGIIPDGLFVLHKCDNPPCVNPHHLFLGTAKVNAQDKVQKGREPRGESHSNSKFTESQIRAMFEDRRPYKEIVAEYGISKPHLCGLKKGKFWRHLQLGSSK